MSELDKAIAASRERVNAANFRQVVMDAMHVVPFEQVDTLAALNQTLPACVQAALWVAFKASGK